MRAYNSKVKGQCTRIRKYPHNLNLELNLLKVCELLIDQMKKWKVRLWPYEHQACLEVELNMSSNQLFVLGALRLHWIQLQGHQNSCCIKHK